MPTKVNYDEYWDSIEHYIEKGKTSNEIINLLNLPVKRRALERAIKRRRETTIAQAKQLRVVEKIIPTINNSDKKESPTQLQTSGKPYDLSIEEVSEIPYGMLKPTGYVSSLSHVEWGKKYCRFEWDKPYLNELADKIWDTQKILVKIGRDHGKTWTMIKLWARWGPEVGSKIIAVATQAKYTEIHYAVLNIWQSATFRKDYGDLIERASLNNGIWFVESLRPRVGANFIVKGIDGAITGLHFEEDDEKGGWFHLEDVVLEVKVGLAPERRVRNWFRRTVRYIKSTKTKFTANGTSKDPDDLYQMMEDKFHWPVELMKALEIVEGRLPTVAEVEVDHDAEILLSWPQVGKYRTLDCPNWPLSRLLYEFIFHPEDAEPELNNNPINPQGAYFPADDWQEQELTHEDYSNYAVVDPAFGGSATSSKTAILLLSIFRGRMYIRDAFIGNAAFDEIEDMLFDFYTRYQTLGTLVEDNFRQISRSFNRNTRLQYLPGLRLTTSMGNKKERIGALIFPYRKREIIIDVNCKFKKEIKEEYLTFELELSPTELMKKFNALDALSMGYLKLRTYLTGSEKDEQRTGGAWGKIE